MDKEVQSELYQLIDGTEEQFLEYCKDKNVGFLMGLKNLIIMTYNETTKVKDDFVIEFYKGKIAGTKDNVKLIEGLYAKLLRLEHRMFLVRDLISEKTL